MFTLTSLLQWDENLFSGLDVSKINQMFDPKDNIPPMKQDVLINTIMFRCGLLQPIYSEPGTNKMLYKIWWEGETYNFAQMWRSMHLEYNPIENYNRYEDSKTTMERDHDDNDTLTTNGSDVEKLSGTDRNTEGGTDTNTLGGSDSERLGGTDTTRDSGNDVVEHQVSAFNESTYQNKDKDTTNYGKATDIDYGRSTTTQYGKTESTKFGHTNALDYGRTQTTQYGRGQNRKFTQDHHDYDEFHAHVHGNIGVTTTQEMIQAELKLRATTVYELIAKDFEGKFCIGVY